jgi:hypothetical protein
MRGSDHLTVDAYQLFLEAVTFISSRNAKMAGANLMESKRVKIYLGFMVDADETL